MAGEVDLNGEDAELSGGDVKQRRERSTIEFPYSDLMAASNLTRVLYERGGGTASPKQLAGWMDQSPTSGTFRTRLSAARLFGFLETERNGVQITPLGRDAIDERKWPSAFLQGFFNVPLFVKMFEKHEGYALPPPIAIEKQMVELGVSSKQADRARQTFVSSATAAGFIDAQSGRLVQPRVDAPNVEPEADATGPVADSQPTHQKRPSLHPFIEGLLETLPTTEAFPEWTIEDQAEWLSAAVGIFKLLSKAKGRISVSVNDDKTTAADQ